MRMTRLKNIATLRYGDALASNIREDAGQVSVYGSNGRVGAHVKANTFGDTIIVGRKGSYGKVLYSSEPVFVIDTAYSIDKKTTKTNLRWLYYALQALDLENGSLDTGVPGLSRDFAYNSLVPFVQKEEQQSIADYLDKKTAIIDKVIAAKNRLLDDLELAARATIFSITTKGLSNASMVDSGEEWLGEVPASWKRTYLMGCGFELKKKNSPGNIVTLLSLSYGKLIIKDINDNGGLLPESFDTYQILKKGQTVLRLTDLQNDHRSLRVGYVGQDGMITSAYSCITAKPNIDPKYLYYYLHSADLRKVFYSMGGGVRQSMKFDDLKRLDMYIPPTIEEQQAIVGVVDAAIEKMVTLQNKVKHSIRLLEEYRSSLISNVVGGKVEV